MRFPQDFSLKISWGAVESTFATKIARAARAIKHNLEDAAVLVAASSKHLQVHLQLARFSSENLAGRGEVHLNSKNQLYRVNTLKLKHEIFLENLVGRGEVYLNSQSQLYRVNTLKLKRKIFLENLVGRGEIHLNSQSQHYRANTFKSEARDFPRKSCGARWSQPLQQKLLALREQ